MWGELIGAGLNYFFGNRGGQDTPQMADPWGPQRSQYQDRLNQLMQRGFSPNDPAYKARMDAGTGAIERSAAARGMLGSGNTLAELTQFGQQQASQEYQNQFDRLAQLAGVSAGSPVAAAQLRQGQQQASAAGAGILGGKLWDTFSQWYNKPKAQTTDQYGFATNAAGETLSF